ncbi:MAG: YcfL family protein [Opitutales bacterium]
MKTLPLSFLAVGLTLGFAGCATSVNTVEPAAPLAQPNRVQDSRVITDRSLAGALLIEGVNEATVSGDLLQVQVNVRNDRRRPLTFNYRFDWIERDGMVVDRVGGWQATTLQGKEPGVLNGVAPNPDVVDFRLHLLESN